MNKITLKLILTISLISAFLLACEIADNDSSNPNTGVGDSSISSNCDGSCANQQSSFLTITDTENIIAQAVNEAKLHNMPGTIAVVDRVGNVLAVFRMNNASEEITITSGNNISGGLEDINIIPDTMAAISKAVTAAYLSTEGNAFSTRTASQIIQENFNPGERDQSSGPLFGVQFSQLACSDFSQRFDPGQSSVGPKRSPLGLSADPGGFPLYKNGTVVGGIGVIADDIYGLDKNILNYDSNIDELIALAGSFGFVAPPDRRANHITVVGKTLRFSDVQFNHLLTKPSAAPTFDSINSTNSEGTLVTVRGYYDGGDVLNPIVITGTAFSQSESGIRADTENFNANLDAFVFVDENDNNRYPAKAGTDSPNGNTSNALTSVEVQKILEKALEIANKSRAQIRRPTGSQARVSISIVDTNGEILGMVRGRDAPIFGSDVSIQKARTAAFFSGTGQTNSPANILRALPDPIYLDKTITELTTPRANFDNYVSAVQTFIGISDALESTGEAVAFSDRAGGNISRPTYPDGPSNKSAGPFSKPSGQWSIFSTGLQLDLVYNALIHHVGYVKQVPGFEADNSDVSQNCTGSTGLTGSFSNQNSTSKIANGIQIFPGSVPIYRGNSLIGGIGVSGDGVDQDDMISFLGVEEAAKSLSSEINNAPKSIRADNLSPQGTRLRFISCPQSPFVNSDEQNVCEGL